MKKKIVVANCDLFMQIQKKSNYISDREIKKGGAFHKRNKIQCSGSKIDGLSIVSGTINRNFASEDRKIQTNMESYVKYTFVYLST